MQATRMWKAVCCFDRSKRPEGVVYCTAPTKRECRERIEAYRIEKGYAKTPVEFTRLPAARAPVMPCKE